MAVVVTVVAYWVVPPRSTSPSTASPEVKPPTTEESAGVQVVPEVNPVREAAPVYDTVSREFLFLRPPGRLDKPARPLDLRNSPAAVFDWAYDNGGFDIFATEIAMTVVGRSRDAVVLTDFKVKEKCRMPTASYVVRVEGLEGGGGVPRRTISVNLDDPTSRVKTTGGEFDHPEPWSFPLKVTSGEPEYFDISVHTELFECSWTAELHYVANGKPQVHRIDNGGRPFRTSGVSGVVEAYTTRDGRAFDLEPDW